MVRSTYGPREVIGDCGGDKESEAKGRIGGRIGGPFLHSFKCYSSEKAEEVCEIYL